MNNYYHEFHIGFNWWFIIVPLMFVASILFATLLYSLKARRRDGRLRVRQNYKQVTQLFVAVPFTLLSVWMIASESWSGIVQIFDNRLAANDSPAWSIILAAGAIGFVACVLFGLYYEAAFYLGRAAKCALYRKTIKVAELRSKIVPLPDETIIKLESRNWDED